MVADGMGGHVAGEVASRVAVEAIEAFIEETAGADKNRTWPFPFDPTLSLEANRLKAAFRLANRRIADDDRRLARICAAWRRPRRRCWPATTRRCVAHVGDSRVYVLRDGKLAQITHDHSWVEEQVRAGTLSPSAARQHPWRNVVTRALSGGEDPEVDVTELDAAARRALPALLGRPVRASSPTTQIAEILGDTRRVARRRSASG